MKTWCDERLPLSRWGSVLCQLLTVVWLQLLSLGLVFGRGELHVAREALHTALEHVLGQVALHVGALDAD